MVRVRSAEDRGWILSLLSILSVFIGIPLYPVEAIENGDEVDSKERQ